MVKKSRTLEEKQAINLFKDILKQDVKKLGKFIIGKYKLTISNRILADPRDFGNILDSSLSRKLFKDILEGGIQKFGKFTIGKYNLYISNKIPLTNQERVKRYNELHPDKMSEQYKLRRDKYHESKGKGMCVKCHTRKAVKNRIMCKSCRRKDSEYQKKARREKRWKNM